MLIFYEKVQWFEVISLAKYPRPKGKLVRQTGSTDKIVPSLHFRSAGKIEYLDLHGKASLKQIGLECLNTSKIGIDKGRPYPHLVIRIMRPARHTLHRKGPLTAGQGKDDFHPRGVFVFMDMKFIFFRN